MSERENPIITVLRELGPELGLCEKTAEAITAAFPPVAITPELQARIEEAFRKECGRMDAEEVSDEPRQDFGEASQ